jgi:hypothetical protein
MSAIHDAFSDVVALAAAVGGLGGVAAFINAIRKDKDATTRDRPRGPGKDHESNQARSGSPAPWFLILAACSCLLSGTMIIVLRTTRLTHTAPLITLLMVAAAACAVLAIWTGVRPLRRDIGAGQPALALYAGAGLIAAGGALTAALIAGIG